MRILIHGENKPSDNGTDGFILLRGLLVMFVVIICFASAMAAMAAFSRQSSRLLENVQREINRRNGIALQMVSR